MDTNLGTAWLSQISQIVKYIIVFHLVNTRVLI